jgi:hypothetical protein
VSVSEASDAGAHATTTDVVAAAATSAAHSAADAAAADVVPVSSSPVRVRASKSTAAKAAKKASKSHRVADSVAAVPPPLFALARANGSSHATTAAVAAPSAAQEVSAGAAPTTVAASVGDHANAVLLSGTVTAADQAAAATMAAMGVQSTHHDVGPSADLSTGDVPGDGNVDCDQDVGAPAPSHAVTQHDVAARREVLIDLSLDTEAAAVAAASGDAVQCVGADAVVEPAAAVAAPVSCYDIVPLQAPSTAQRKRKATCPLCDKVVPLRSMQLTCYECKQVRRLSCTRLAADRVARVVTCVVALRLRWRLLRVYFQRTHYSCMDLSDFREDIVGAVDVIWLCSACVEVANELSAAVAASQDRTVWCCPICDKGLTGRCSECHRCKEVWPLTRMRLRRDVLCACVCAACDPVACMCAVGARPVREDS